MEILKEFDPLLPSLSGLAFKIFISWHRTPDPAAYRIIDFDTFLKGFRRVLEGVLKGF